MNLTATDLSIQYDFAVPGSEKMVGTHAIATSVVSTRHSNRLVTMTSRQKKMKKTDDLKISNTFDVNVTIKARREATFDYI